MANEFNSTEHETPCGNSFTVQNGAARKNIVIDCGGIDLNGKLPARYVLGYLEDLMSIHLREGIDVTSDAYKKGIDQVLEGIRADQDPHKGGRG